MNIAVQNVKLHIQNIRTRMPFRYGIAVMTALPHLFVSVECEIDGQLQVGIAADSLAPKWFTKDPNTSHREEVAEMLKVIEAAAKFAQDSEGATSVFELWQQIYAAQKKWATEQGYPPLLWNFGISLIERAVIDAFCRATDTSFAQALRANTLGIRLPRRWLPFPSVSRRREGGTSRKPKRHTRRRCRFLTTPPPRGTTSATSA